MPPQASLLTGTGLVSHRFTLSEGPAAYELFAGRSDGVRERSFRPYPLTLLRAQVLSDTPFRSE
ncbi:hypothetical protein [Streptomyces sp. KR55]|uniref:hypothetical protein n=1 Tax=Streptomyces sp. KR55 TaxID=3457425 RepID=UPI003FCF2AE3